MMSVGGRTLLNMTTAQPLNVPVISSFRGPYFFLSNFSPWITPYGGRQFATSEHAYMAARTDDADAIAAILATADPARAQLIGRAAPLIDGWERRRFTVMEAIVAAKFDHHPDLTAQLIATRGSLLVEGNTWHDQTWGSCTCDRHRDIPGDNALGVCLMAVRMRIAATSA